MKNILKSQKGAFSPYMFGMLAGLAIFSSMMAYQARKDILEAEQRKLEQQQEEAEDLMEALENALLTETSATYSADLTLDRAQNFATMASGKTRAGSDITFNQQDSETAYSLDHQRVAITTSDDTLLQNTVSGLTDADAIAGYDAGDSQAVAVFDSKATREQQMDLSYQFMENQATLVYQFYAGNLRFPNSTEYDDLAAISGLTDVWGGAFSYTYISDTSARLTFTTPWGHTQTINMNFN